MSREIPTLFATPMVRAILDGRKTQTRRICKTPLWEPVMERAFAPGCGVYRHANGVDEVRPQWSAGDLLWVRETWAPFADGVTQREGAPRRSDHIAYRADGEWTDPRWSWRPSIHMPKWAARIWLAVTGVRVERLQDISEEDARAEGVGLRDLEGIGDDQPIACDTLGRTKAAHPYTLGYAMLWDSINADSLKWGDNPWVWVVSFKRVERKAVAP